MNWTDLIQQIMEICIIPLLGVLATYLITLIKQKRDAIIASSENEVQEKYIRLLADIISDCVRATNQTYVEAMKKGGFFTEEAQKEAFNRTYKSIMAILDKEALTVLNYVYGDLQTYITERIEAEVNWEK